MSGPIVSVLLPVYNGGALLPASIQSIFAQTFTAWELIVVNDGSTDDTAKFVRSLTDPRVRILTNEGNCGLTRSLNRGLEAARGEFIARQDADDLSDPRRLQKQLDYCHDNPAVALVGSSAWRLNPAGQIAGTNDLPLTHDAIRWASATDNPFLHTSVMFRRMTILTDFGGYDESFAICQDYDLWNRIAARHRVANLPERLVRMREHPGSMTQTRAGETNTEARRALEANWVDLFPETTLSAAERDLLARFRLQLLPPELPQLRRLLDRLLDQFLARHPTARGSKDFRATLCRQSLRLAYKSFRAAPQAAMREAVRAFFQSPAESFRQAIAARYYLRRNASS